MRWSYLTTKEYRSHHLPSLTSPRNRALQPSLPAPLALLRSIPYPNSGLCTTPESLSSGARGKNLKGCCRPDVDKLRLSNRKNRTAALTGS